MHDNLSYKIQHQPQELLLLLHDLEEREYCYRPQGGKWSIHDNLAHLGRYQEVFGKRIQRMLTEKDPTLLRYKADEDPGFGLWQRKERPGLIGDYLEERDRLSSELLLLSSIQLERKGIHPIFGPMDIQTWIHFFLLHESHHLYTVFRLRQGQQMNR